MAEKKVKDWFTMNGKHIPIYEGESKEDAVNRSVAKSNEEKKQADIQRNKEEIDKLNNKEEKPKSFVDMMNDTLSFSKNPDKSERMKKKGEFAKWLDANATHQEKTVNTGENFLGITGGNAWYQNKSGTIFILGNDKHWHKLGNDLTLSRDHKISDNEKERLKKLIESKVK